MTRESVMFTDSDDDLDFKKLLKASKSTDDYPEAFIHAIRNSTARNLLTASSTCSPHLSYSDSKLFQGRLIW